MEPGGIEPPSTRGISRRIRRFRRARGARRSVGRTGGETGRRTGANGRPGTRASPAHVAAERRGRPRPARRRPGPPRGGVGQPAPRRACRDRRGASHGHARPLTSPDARQNRRNPQRRDAAGHRRPFRRRQRRRGSFPPGVPMRRPREQPRVSNDFVLHVRCLPAIGTRFHQQRFRLLIHELGCSPTEGHPRTSRRVLRTRRIGYRIAIRRQCSWIIHATWRTASTQPLPRHPRSSDRSVLLNRQDRIGGARWHVTASQTSFSVGISLIQQYAKHHH